MHIKSNKGVIGTDIAIAIIILMLFVTIATKIFYQIGISNIRTTRKAEATNCAVNVLEYIKLMGYSEYQNLDFSADDGNETQWCKNKNINIPNGYDVKIEKQDIDDEKAELIQEVKVTISYKVKDKDESITIKTLKVNK